MPAEERGAEPSSAAEPSHEKAGEQARRRPSFWVRMLQRYVFLYLFVVVLGLAADALLRSHLDSQQRAALNALTWGGTALYALALVVLLVEFTRRLHLRRHRSKSIWVLFLGLAGLLVARGYFSASLLEQSIPQGKLAVAMSDLGLAAGSAIILGMIWGIVDVAIYAAREAEARARRFRLPRFRRSGQGKI